MTRTVRADVRCQDLTLTLTLTLTLALALTLTLTLTLTLALALSPSLSLSLSLYLFLSLARHCCRSSCVCVDPRPRIIPGYPWVSLSGDIPGYPALLLLYCNLVSSCMGTPLS